MIDKTQAMMNAITEGDVSKVDQLLAESPDDFKGEIMSGDNSILAHAISSGNPNIVSKLVAAGAKLAEFEFNQYRDVIPLDQKIRDAAILPPPDLPPPLQPEQDPSQIILPTDPEEINKLAAYLRERLDQEIYGGEIPEPPSRIVAPHLLSRSGQEAKESAERKARIADIDVRDPEVIEKAKGFIEEISEGFFDETLGKQMRYTRWHMIDGVEEFIALNESDALSVMNQKAIAKFEAVFNELTGGEINTPEYKNAIANIIALNEKFLNPNREPGFALSVQAELAKLQTNLGILYANNPDIQKRISIKGFVDGVQQNLDIMLEQLNMDLDILTGIPTDGVEYGKLKFSPELVLAPIDRAAGAMRRDAVVLDEDVRYLEAIYAFKKEFNIMIGDRGRESPEYKLIYGEIEAMRKLFTTRLPGTERFAQAAEIHLDNLQSLMGQFYAANKDVQQHLSIKDFMDGVGGIVEQLVNKLEVSAGRDKLIPVAEFTLGPIAHAAATGKMERHSSAIKNVESYNYLKSGAGRVGRFGRLAKDKAKGMEMFNVLDKFELATIINEDPDMVVRYIKSLREKGGTQASAETIEAMGKMLDLFTSDATKQKMAEIASKLEDKEVPWYALATHIGNAIEAVKSGIEQLTGYDDITSAIGELGVLYDVYGSLFKGEEVREAGEQVKGFVGRILKETAGREKGIVSDFREAVEDLIADNGRGSAEFRVVLNEIAKLEKLVSEIGGRTSSDQLKALQANMNDIAFAVANLYANNPAIQQHVSLRDFSEVIAKGMMELADVINDQCRLKGDLKLYPKSQQALVMTLAAQPAEKLNETGSTASRIDANNYLTALQESWKAEPGVREDANHMQAINKLTNNLNAKDNFKLAELINKDPERLMRVMEEMLKRGALLPKTTDNEEAKEKVATVLDYLSSDKTKANMDKMLKGDFEKGMFAELAIAIEKGINWLTGFDKEVENAFKELNNITAMQHDMIAQYAEAASREDEREKPEAKSFVERVSKPQIQVHEIS